MLHILGADNLTFEGGYGWVQKKTSCRLTSREIPTQKKITFMAYNLGKKVLHIHMLGKKIPSPEVLVKKFLSNQISYPLPPPPKSQMVGPLPPTFKPVLQQIKVDEATCVTTDSRDNWLLIKTRESTFATCNNLICCNKGLNVRGKTRNIAIQLILQQCCKTSSTFLLLVLQYTSKVATLKVSNYIPTISEDNERWPTPRSYNIEQFSKRERIWKSNPC